MSSIVMEELLKRNVHVNHFLLLSHILPEHYIGLDCSKLSGIYFIVIALDLLDNLHDIAMKERFITSVYSYQLHPSTEQELRAGKFGFISGHFMTVDPNHSEKDSLFELSNAKYQHGHIAMIYTALATLLTLGDDLSRVQVDFIKEGLRLLQTEDGSFRAYLYEGESDMRFLYCACAIAKMLNIWEVINIPRAMSFVKSCFTYEGGFSLTPGSEAHGGATYTALASLALMNKLDEAMSEKEKKYAISWCLHRQNGGFQGRTNKDIDSCYSFWVGASLKILGVFHEVDVQSTNHFVLETCQVTKHTGGFRKCEDAYPDLLHSFYSICWLSLAGILKPIDPLLAIPLQQSEENPQSEKIVI